MMKRVYSCNICHDEICRDNLRYSVGIHFTSNGKFTLGNYGCTEGTHICPSCILQLHDGLQDNHQYIEEYRATILPERPLPPTTSSQSQESK